jgi:transcriptional regulator with XRE-family HTH domain
MSLRELRKAQSLTVEKVATELGKSHASVSNWESGKWEPQLTPEETERYCQLLGVKFDEFLNACRRSRQAWIEKQRDRASSK